MLSPWSISFLFNLYIYSFDMKKYFDEKAYNIDCRGHTLLGVNKIKPCLLK